jgi:hypothetical protein
MKIQEFKIGGNMQTMQLTLSFIYVCHYYSEILEQRDQYMLKL